VVTAVASTVLTSAAVVAFVYFLVVNGTYTLQLAFAARELRERHARVALAPFDWWHRTPDTPRLTVIAPAYNEEVTVVDAVEGMLTLEYPDLEVVVVNDGSPDGTLDVLCTAFDLVPDPHAETGASARDTTDGSLASAPIRTVYRSALHPGLVVVDKDNGGKADALNAGIEVASGDLFVALDADTIVAPDALLRMARAFLERPGTVAVGGTIRPVNGDRIADGRVVRRGVPRSWFGAVQTVEYVRAFFIGRLGWNRMGGNVIISGAFGTFHRGSVIAVGGYQHGSIGEDFELVVRLRRRGIEEGTGSRVQFLPDPVAFTEAPTTRAVLSSQRRRWHRGLLDTLHQHRRVVLNPRYRVLGLGGMGFMVGVEAAGPVIELVGLLALLVGLSLGLIAPEFAVLFFAVAYLWGVLLSLGSLILESWVTPGQLRARDRGRQVVAALAEPIWFRQLTLWWRLAATVRWLRRGETTWGTMTRTGFRSDPTTTSD
jgi:cellulose synthase/poly-beta-1,6-N-acetylglucosamine synthase-like glycosyltransferase